MSRFNQAALVKKVLACERPATEAMAIIGSMSGVVACHCGPETTARMLRVCADLTERLDLENPSSLVEELCAMLQESGK